MKSGIRIRRTQQARLAEARRELSALRDTLTDTYAVFNRTTDPALLEASILEISALQCKCDCLLRSIKNMNGELQNAASDYHCRRHPDRSHTG